MSFGKKIREKRKKRQSATALSAIYHREIETHTHREWKKSYIFICGKVSPRLYDASVLTIKVFDFFPQ